MIGRRSSLFTVDVSGGGGIHKFGGVAEEHKVH